MGLTPGKGDANLSRLGKLKLEWSGHIPPLPAVFGPTGGQMSLELRGDHEGCTPTMENL